MAENAVEEESPVPGEGEAESEEAGQSRLRRSRGRPRLPDSDRVRRRLESRKKYDVRRVYLGEAHELWAELRGRSGWSDAKLAAYLIELEGRHGRRHAGKSGEENSKTAKHTRARRRSVNCLRSLVAWYEDHKISCPHEPSLLELDSIFQFSTTAVWQCASGHRYLQRLASPQNYTSDSEDGDDSDTAAGSDEITPVSQQEQPPEQSESEDKVRENGTELIVKEAEEAEVAEVMDLSSQLDHEQQEEPQETDQRDPAAIIEENHSFPPQGGDQPISETFTENTAHEQMAEVCPASALNPQENLETVVCVPLQVSSSSEGLYESMGQDALGEVVTSCSMPGMVQSSQVIIIAGPGYGALTSEGIHLNVTGGSGEEVTCTMIEGVAYNATCNVSEIEEKQTVQEEGLRLAETEDLDYSALDSEIQDDVQRPRRIRRGRVFDADGMLKMFHCPYEGCSQVYVALSSFQNHVNLVHRKGKTKVCPHPGCGKKFYLSNHLRRHMIIHSGVRDFICETCGKSFKRKNHLEVHRRTHTGETPLQCEICGYQCRQRASLNWHMKKHISDIHYNFTCEHCGKRFEKMESVKFHKLKSHPENPTT
ncbi:zinc finger protein 653 isoform X2 [Latimeria chalumnae]|uniref:zinc finger protein 653 isoform X2 n=1 Tax=Latimeria chalumnae TaxID=7897 RepID=UPI00313E7753